MANPQVRIDKWLWAARFFKTRSLASEMVSAGHVQMNHERVKPSRGVQVGVTLTIQRNQERFIVTITALAEKRGSAAIAQTLYIETEQSLAARETQNELHKMHAFNGPAPDKRPDKKARRQIIRFRRQND
ncbi:MAG: RNA-binding protein [Zetaproteobacteria bacterium CG_4_9_14_3_um_filter_49_83]|nr:MAG: RNA-binding protein [Zetaproteobacteria bacterium CG1_02_49_23]PIQ31810.1 MAG: RNA-binding protein [Zetaproteobacteria bacterium CG17_big_fil_post_rev_8_21_14_2_50_50_13]PIV30272.1 MAG: RNA-binding protein [Zetaproteobacteria bacterium CG02_land_8_20_14_3_00_50_9]PIY56173.1 MAG: RNA-binding protein [Zetaproteobacteria bacterium CG_4_10_14_0_8_um_filter_49_80]PJA36451.1 MAG: RNA-binding protein [Zetaproteobacteria bacterium CG_4_9_14_3_um_filter_49_83]